MLTGPRYFGQCALSFRVIKIFVCGENMSDRYVRDSLSFLEIVIKKKKNKVKQVLRPLS
jgi:hypothetical protein